jgi:branched-subunit amino acid transport protein
VTDVLTIVVIALAVYLPKGLPMLLVSDRLLKAIGRWLEFVAPAVLAALVAPSIFISDGALATPRLVHLAFVGTFVVAILTRRMLPAVAAGVAVLVALVVLGPAASTM